MKKVFSIILIVILSLTIVTPALGAVIVDSGECGDGVCWTLTDDKVLTISGNGEVYSDYFWGRGNPPWLGLDFTRVIIEEGVTYIGDVFTLSGTYPAPKVTSISLPSTLKGVDRTFMGFEVADVYIPDGLRGLGQSSFQDCSDLKRVYIPSSLSHIGLAFIGCTALEEVYFGGTEAEWKAIEKSLHISDYSNPTIYFNAKDNNPLMYLAPNPNSAPTPDPTPISTDGPSSWAIADMDAAIEKGLVSKELRASSKRAITRIETTGILANLLEKTNGKNLDAILSEKGATINENAFIDTDDPKVLKLNALGVAAGKGNGKFGPNDTLTRAQITAFINRIANLNGISTAGYTHPFTNVEGHWVDKELGWSYQQKIIAGMGNNKFAPDEELTVEQTVAIANRAFSKLEK